MPAAAAFALTGALIAVGLWLAARWTDSTGWQIVASVGAVIAAVILGATLAQSVSGPALDALVREQEEALGLPAPRASTFAASLGRSLRVTLTTLALGVPPILLLSLVDVVFPPAIVVTWPLKLILSALLATWSFVDYPFAARGAGVRVRFAWFRAHLAAALGFGAVMAILSMVPLVGLFVLPVGVVGATRLLAETDRRG